MIDLLKKWGMKAIGAVGVGGFLGAAIFAIGWYLEIQDHKDTMEAHLIYMQNEVRLHQIEVNHQEIEDLEELRNHLMGDVHDLANQILIMRTQFDMLGRNMGYAFNRLDGVEVIQTAALRRDSVSKAIKPIER